MPTKKPTSKLGALLTIGQAAKMARWSEKIGDDGWHRMRRYLLKVNAELGGLLLVNRGAKGRNARWVIAEPALKRLHPDWFEREEIIQALGRTNQRVDAVSEKVSELVEIVEVQSKAIGKILRKAG